MLIITSLHVICSGADGLHFVYLFRRQVTTNGAYKVRLHVWTMKSSPSWLHYHSSAACDLWLFRRRFPFFKAPRTAWVAYSCFAASVLAATPVHKSNRPNSILAFINLIKRAPKQTGTISEYAAYRQTNEASGLPNLKSAEPIIKKETRPVIIIS